jgi:hypothetical protein
MRVEKKIQFKLFTRFFLLFPDFFVRIKHFFTIILKNDILKRLKLLPELPLRSSSKFPKQATNESTSFCLMCDD